MPIHYNLDEKGHISEADALDRLNRNSVKTYDKTITVSTAQQLGLKLWTCIDCLVNHYKYTLNRGQ